jgi:hypothetical protein
MTNGYQRLGTLGVCILVQQDSNCPYINNIKPSRSLASLLAKVQLNENGQNDDNKSQD